jgi:hypothetical protein
MGTAAALERLRAEEHLAMELTRYFVTSQDGKWAVIVEGQAVARCATPEDAVTRAVRMAQLMGKMGHCADVMLERDCALSLVWSYGEDPGKVSLH